MDTLLRKVGIHMPQYHDYPNYNGCSITVSPLGQWRKIFRRLPYFAGDRIGLRITFSGMDADLNKLAVYLIYPGSTKDRKHEDHWNMGIKDGKGIIQQYSHILGTTGIFTAYLAERAGDGVVNSYDASAPLFSADITHKDTWFWPIIGTVIAILGIVIGVLINILKAKVSP